MNGYRDDDDVNDVFTVQQVRRALTAFAGRAEATPACLDEHTIASLADGTLDVARREAALPHVAACAACRAAVASVARALADAGVAREITAAQGVPRRWIARIALPLAAAAALAVILARSRADVDPTLHRAPTITAGAAPAAVAPVGQVARAGALRWSAVEGADRYRVTLFDADGVVLYAGEVAGTTAAIPDSVRLVSGPRYLWRVEARLGFDRWSASELIEFSIVGAPPR